MVRLRGGTHPGGATLRDQGSPLFGERRRGGFSRQRPDVKATFQQKLEEYLYAEKTFDKGKELTIKYRFIQFDPGNQFTRWFWGGIGNAGEGSLTVEAKFYDADNQELATIQSEGRIGSGFFGGDFSYAVDKAAEKIAEYTKVNFK